MGQEGIKCTGLHTMAEQQEKLEYLMRSMTVLLRDMEYLRAHCEHYNPELRRYIMELCVENRNLTEKNNALDKELQEAWEIIEELRDTKYALDAKERQTEKLNRRL
ncbi:hypothetical protein DNTS_034477 [Danionella cerebrum]|uniref:Uncharacterized protein n=1 Tax=Danionella cerebrum TaxID=2873325 RepID=A0A553RJS0_9TELE|nr:hypothetical protein DNTS_034477 [Danionella translucida]